MESRIKKNQEIKENTQTLSIIKENKEAKNKLQLSIKKKKRINNKKSIQEIEEELYKKRRTSLPKRFLLAFRRFVTIPIYYDSINQTKAAIEIEKEVPLFINNEYMNFFEECIWKLDKRLIDKDEEKIKTKNKLTDKLKENNPNYWNILYNTLMSKTKINNIDYAIYKFIKAKTEKIYKKLCSLTKKLKKYTLKDIILHYLLLSKTKSNFLISSPFSFGFSITQEERDTIPVFKDVDDKIENILNKNLLDIKLSILQNKQNKYKALIKQKIIKEKKIKNDIEKYKKKRLSLFKNNLPLDYAFPTLTNYSKKGRSVNKSIIKNTIVHTHNNLPSLFNTNNKKDNKCSRFNKQNKINLLTIGSYNTIDKTQLHSDRSSKNTIKKNKFVNFFKKGDFFF